MCIGPVRGVRAPRGCWGPCRGAEHPAGAFPFAFKAASLWGRAGILGASDGNRRKSGFHLTPRVAPSRVSHAGVKRRGEANGASCGVDSVRSLCAQQGQRLLARGLHCLRPAVRVRGARGDPAAGGSASPVPPRGAGRARAVAVLRGRFGTAARGATSMGVQRIGVSQPLRFIGGLGLAADSPGSVLGLKTRE